MAGRAIRKNRRNKRKKRTHERQQAFKKLARDKEAEYWDNKDTSEILEEALKHGNGNSL